ncbi:MAG: hypothetical protein KDC57_07595, partial [Saprospiraceae bacterium]|nr:hypothetical protein [Saprospiraceae bacterium]
MYRILHLPALLLSVLAFAFPAQAQVTTIDFNYTGSSQAWVVPTGVNAVLIKAWGAQGGGGGLVPGGRGGYATGLLAVTPGQTLNIYVGGAGLVTSGSNTNVAGGFNGGGQATRATSGAILLRNRASGGGASDVRLGGMALTDRVIVGAGGGGYGGAGGGLNGVAANGGGGTQASGGAGGSGCSAGSLGQGGEGSTAGCSGGGGGYYGGGSGNTGGGGSSFLGGVNNGFTLENIQEGNGFISISYGEGLLAIFDDQTDFINSAVSACVDSVSGISSEVLEDFESYSPGLYNSGFTGNGFSVSLVESGVAAGNIEILNIGSNVIRIQPDTLNFGTTGEDLICLTFDEPVTSVGADFILTALNLLGHEGLTLEAVLTMMDGTVEILNLPAGGPLTSLNISAGYLGISDRTGCNKIAKLTFRVSGLDPILNPGQLGLGLILDNLYFNSCDCTCRVESCHDQVNISLDGDCSRPVSALDVMTNVSLGCSNAFNVSLTDQWGNALGNTIGLDQVGQKITYRVTDPGSGNSCWGYIKVEDKYPPQILCVNDTISCFDLSERAELTVAGDNCFYDPTKTNILEKQWIDLGCDDREFIGYMARRIRASDIWGNFNECRDTLFVRKETIDSLVCGTDTTIECTTEVIRNGKTVELLWNAGKDGDTYLDAQGYAHPWPTKGDGFFPAPSIKSTQTGQEPGYLLPGRTDIGPDFANSGKCQIVFDYDDHIVPTCGRSYKIRRTWHVYDWCGHRDTTCVQWFKITDTESPEIKEAYLHSTDDNGGSNCDEVPLSLIILAREKNAWLACGVLEAEVDPHDCKATVILPDPRAWVLKDCDDQLEVFYEIEYIDPGHPGKTLLESGTIPEGGTAHVYLPAGWHQVLYHIRDRCWNETLLLQGIGVYDNTPPTPVCDEITQVTLDPKECWARVYAKDLDDGSHDNCCNQLHFAVANMDSVTYWRNYWHDYILDCVGHSDYYANQDGYDTY